MPLFRFNYTSQDLESALFNSHKSLAELVLESQQQLGRQTPAAGLAAAAVVEPNACPYTVSDLASFLHQQRARSTSLESRHSPIPAGAVAAAAVAVSPRPSITAGERRLSDLARSPCERERRTSTTDRLAPALTATRSTTYAHGLCASGSMSMPLEPVPPEPDVAQSSRHNAIGDHSRGSIDGEQIGAWAAAQPADTLWTAASTTTAAAPHHDRDNDNEPQQQQSTGARSSCVRVATKQNPPPSGTATRGSERKRTTSGSPFPASPNAGPNPDPDHGPSPRPPSLFVPVTGDMPPSGLLQNLSEIATAVVPSYAAEVCSSPATLAAVASIVENEEVAAGEEPQRLELVAPATREEPEEEKRTTTVAVALLAGRKRVVAGSHTSALAAVTNTDARAAVIDEAEVDVSPPQKVCKLNNNRGCGGRSIIDKPRPRRRATPSKSSVSLSASPPPSRYTPLQVPRYQPRIVASPSPPPSSGLVSTDYA